VPPGASGSVRLAIRMVQDGVEWFGNAYSWSIAISPSALPDVVVDSVAVSPPNPAPGQKVSFPAWSYAHARHIVWVRKGRLTLSEGADRHELKPGDCLGLGPPTAVTYANESETPCSYVVALARS